MSTKRTHRKQAISHEHASSEHEQTRARTSTTRYPRNTKIACVTAMLTVNADHPTSNASLDAARKILQAPVNVATLETWLHIYGDEVRQAMLPVVLQSDAEIVRATQDTLVKDLLSIQKMVVDHIKDDPKVVGSASLRDSMVAMGISSDKIERWLGVSVDMRIRCQRLQGYAQQAGFDPLVAFDDFLDVCKQQVEIVRSKQSTNGRQIPSFNSLGATNGSDTINGELVDNQNDDTAGTAANSAS